jgi:competence protein ComEC
LRVLANKLGIRVVRRTVGDMMNWGGARIDILSPPTDYETTERVSNNDSLVLAFHYGVNSFLLTGDVERRMEQRMLDGNLIQHADFLKIAHHGSKSSTTQAFLDAASPRFAVLSAGLDNPYRHPSSEVVERIRQIPGARLLRTDEDGQVRILSNGKSISVYPYLR